MRKVDMKMLLIGIGIVCVMIAIATIATPHDLVREHNLLPGRVYSFEPYMNENMRKILQKDVLMAEGDSVTLHVDIEDQEDLLIFANGFGIFSCELTVHKPDGNVSLYKELSHINLTRPPLVIPVDVAGTWSVTLTRVPSKTWENDTFAFKNGDLSLMLASQPAAMEMVELPGATDDPYLLARIVPDLPGEIVVTKLVPSGLGPRVEKKEEIFSLSQPLDEGFNELIFQRIMPDGRASKSPIHNLIVDLHAPVIMLGGDIMLGDVERETSFPRVTFIIKLSANVMDFSISGNGSTTILCAQPMSSMDWGFPGRDFSIGRDYFRRTMPGIEEVRCLVPLEIGVNRFELRAISFAGHETVRTVTVTRQGEVPEYVEMDGYWLYNYYDEDGSFVQEWIYDGNTAFIKPSDESGEVAQSYMPGITDEALLYDQYMEDMENMRKILQKEILMAEGDSVTVHVDIEEEDLYLFAHGLYYDEIIVHRPDGSVILHTEISSSFFSNLPLVIHGGEAGTWKVTLTRGNRENNPLMRNLLLMLASYPTAVELDLPKVIDDPYLLSRLVADLPGTVVVTEVVLDEATWRQVEKPLSLSQPLAEGRHVLIFQRVTSDGRVSDMWGPGSYHDLIVDTLAPEIMLGDFERERDLPRVRLKLRLSDNVETFYINGKRDDSDCKTLGVEIGQTVPLKMGVNLFELRAVSFAGRETVQTVTVTRQVPEYSEAARSLLLGIIDEALIKATEDTPDYLEPDGCELYFRNSISLQTLRDAIKNAEMVRVNYNSVGFYPPLIYVGEQRICGRNSFFYEYPDGTWWDVKVDNWYVLLLNDYIFRIGENGEGFGVGVY